MHDYLHPVMGDHASRLTALSVDSIGLADALILAGLAAFAAGTGFVVAYGVLILSRRWRTTWAHVASKVVSYRRSSAN